MSLRTSKKWFFLLLKTVSLAGIAYYLLSGMDWKHLAESMSGFAPLALIVGFILILLNDLVQGWRWRYLTRRQCSLQASFEAIIVAGFLNMILPAKLGELSRLIYLRNVYHYPFNYGIGSMVIERGADLFVVTCFMAIGAGLVSDNDAVEWAAIMSVGVMVGTVFAINRDKGAFVLYWLKRFPARFVRIYSQKIVRLIVKDIGTDRLVKVLLYTVIVRGFYFLTVAFFLNGIASLGLALDELFIVYLVSSIAFAIPLAPGGTGTVHAGMVMAMGWYGVSKEHALAVAIVYHLFLNFAPLIVALLIIMTKNVPLSRMIRMEERNKGRGTAVAVYVEEGDK